MLSEDQVEEIMIELREGTSYKRISKMFKVSHYSIQDINLGRCYSIDGYNYPVRRAEEAQKRRRLKEMEYE